jgi:hypothetical protein
VQPHSQGYAPLGGFVEELQIKALRAEAQSMRLYVDSLDDSNPEKAGLIAALADAEGELKQYAEKTAADPDDDTSDDTDTDDDESEDGATDPELEKIIEELRSEGYDVGDDGDEDSPDAASDSNPNAGTPAQPANNSGKMAPVTGAKSYAEQRLDRLQTETINDRVNGLVKADKITSAMAGVFKRVCYTLAGVTTEGQSLKAYAEDERDSAVDELLKLLSENSEIGMLRTYTKDDHLSTESKRQLNTAPTVVNGRNVNEDSIDLSAKIKRYAEQHGIQDFGKAMVAYEKANPSEVKRYGEEG